MSKGHDAHDWEKQHLGGATFPSKAEQSRLDEHGGLCCKHGQLNRSCNICELKTTIETLTAQLKTANERAEYALQNQGITERARVEEMRKRDLAEKDSARLNYLERNPRHAQIMIDGVVRDCVFYGITTAELTPIRHAIDTILAEIARGK